MARSERTFQQVVAANVRRLRETRGFSQDDLAARARSLGVDWRRTTVANIENGRKTPTVEVLVVLAASLTVEDETGEPGTVLLADFAHTSGRVMIDGAFSLPGQLVEAALSGSQLVIEPDRVRVSPAAEVELPAGPLPDADDVLRVLEGWREADERAAQRAGIEQEVAAAYMARLWSRPLSEQSVAAAGEHVPGRALAQRKGRATRELSAELLREVRLTQAMAAVAAERVDSSRQFTDEQWWTLRKLATLWPEIRENPDPIFATAAEEQENTVNMLFRQVDRPGWVGVDLLNKLATAMAEGAEHGDDQ